MFIDLQKKVQKQFNKMAANGHLFITDTSRDDIWQVYLQGFTETDRQGNNCNACKSFIRQWGNIVGINDAGDLVSLWDLENVEAEYNQAIKNLADYVKSKPINNIFVENLSSCGTEKNFSHKHNITWHHFHLTLPKRFIENQPDKVRGEARTDKEVLQRALTELTVDATDTVLELIAQNSLYRGAEFENNLKEFLKLQIKFAGIENKEVFCWLNSKNPVIAKIRNSAIGTLLINLSDDMPLEDAVRRYESVVAPYNYKRPTALVSPKMLAQSKATLTELGLLDSLQRRFATEADIDVNNVLFTASNGKMLDVFDTLAAETLVNPKTLNKVEEISISDFITNIVPRAKNIEVLLEKSHFPNFVSLLTAEDANAPSLFKWNNPFSWSYTGNLADSTKDLVKKAGGKVEGVLRFSIRWNDDGKNDIDFDAHCIEPDGNLIYYASCRQPGISRCGGQLDVDIIDPRGKVAVENIVYVRRDKMMRGTYKFLLHNFSHYASKGGFSAEVEADGETFEIEYGKNLGGGQKIPLFNVEYSASGFKVTPLIDAKQSISSLEKWGLKSNQFHKVSKLMFSPNFWDGNAVGNHHYLLMLENCKSDETPRGFYNEYLKQKLDEHRKALELVGGRLEVPYSKEQLSGLGFSSTQRNNLIVRVEGAFKRMLKINF